MSLRIEDGTLSDDIENRFNYHKPDAQAVKDHEEIREVCKSVAHLFDRLPNGREKASAITKLEEAMFWANAAIARDNTKGEK